MPLKGRDPLFSGKVKLLHSEYSEGTFQDIYLVGLCLNPISSIFPEMWGSKFGVRNLQNFKFHHKQKLFDSKWIMKPNFYNRSNFLKLDENCPSYAHQNSPKVPKDHDFTHFRTFFYPVTWSILVKI